jgi:hypothetical protein
MLHELFHLGIVKFEPNSLPEIVRLQDEADQLVAITVASKKAISAGGDCDTNAAIVCGIVALSAGRGRFPEEWLQAREATPRL